MKTVPLEKANLRSCVSQAQSERVIVTQDGAPVAVMIGVTGLDREQVALGVSDHFWSLIEKRRTEPTLSREALEQKLRTPRRRKS